VTPPSVVTEAIVVRLVDYGEADRIATLLTRDAGKISALVRSARKSRKRFGGVTLFGLGQASLRPRGGELWALDAFDAGRGFPGISLDVARVAYAAYVCELARELCAAEAADARLYDLVRETLGRIDAGSCGPVALRCFELALLDALGLAPALDRCVACGGAPADEAGQVLDVAHGGVVCGGCAHGRGRPLGGAVRQALVAAQAGSEVDAAARWALLSPPDAASARDTLQALLGAHLTRPLRSVEFIAKLNAQAAHG